MGATLALALSSLVLAAALAPATASAAWRPGNVFYAPSADGRGFVDFAGNVRWSALSGRPRRALWRSRSARGHLTRPVRLRSTHPTLDVNTHGAGLVAWGSRGSVGGTLYARRRSPSGRYVTPMRQISQGGSLLDTLLGWGIDNRANSVLLWRRGSALYARDMSGAGHLGGIQRLSAGDVSVEKPQLAVSPTGHVAAAWLEYVSGASGPGTQYLKVATAGPSHVFGAPVTVRAFSPKGTEGDQEGPLRQLALAVGPTGTVAVVWIEKGRFVELGTTDHALGDVYVATARPGEAFDAQQLTQGNAPDRRPALAYSRAGAAVVAWTECSSAPIAQLCSQPDGRNQPDVMRAAYSSRGLIFGVRQTLDRTASIDLASAAFDDRGNAVVAWRRSDPARSPYDPAALARPMAAERRPGHSFSAPIALSGSHRGIRSLSVSGGGHGILAVTWDVNQPSLVQTAIHVPARALPAPPRHGRG